MLCISVQLPPQQGQMWNQSSNKFWGKKQQLKVLFLLQYQTFIQNLIWCVNINKQYLSYWFKKIKRVARAAKDNIIQWQCFIVKNWYYRFSGLSLSLLPPFLYKSGHDMARHYYFFLIKLNSCCDSLICWDNPFHICWRGGAKTGKPNSLDYELQVLHEKASAVPMLTLQVRGHWYPGSVVEEIKTMKGFTQSHIRIRMVVQGSDYKVSDLSIIFFLLFFSFFLLLLLLSEAFWQSLYSTDWLWTHCVAQADPNHNHLVSVSRVLEFQIYAAVPSSNLNKTHLNTIHIHQDSSNLISGVRVIPCDYIITPIWHSLVAPDVGNKYN